MEYHPDRNPGDKVAEERFKEVSEAYALLRDPEARARFDRYGPSDPQTYRPDPSSVDWHDVFRDGGIKIDWDSRGGMPTGSSAIFDALFGMMSGLLRGAGVLPGESYQLALPVTLSEQRAGTTKRLKVPATTVCLTCGGSGRVTGQVTPRSPGPFEVTPEGPPPGGVAVCPDCRGRGVRRGALLDVTVPPGALPGSKLRLKGAGGPGTPPGDVLAEVQLSLPAGARLSGQDVHAGLTITPLEARRGTSTEYEGVTVKVPAGSTPGAVVTVPGGGVKGKSAAGNLVLTLDTRWAEGGARLATTWFRKLLGGGKRS